MELQCLEKVESNLRLILRAVVKEMHLLSQTTTDIQIVHEVQYLLLIMQPFETKISLHKVTQTTLNACKRVMDRHYKTK